jgi:hypothetical protein
MSLRCLNYEIIDRPVSLGFEQYRFARHCILVNRCE